MFLQSLKRSTRLLASSTGTAHSDDSSARGDEDFAVADRLTEVGNCSDRGVPPPPPLLPHTHAHVSARISLLSRHFISPVLGPLSSGRKRSIHAGLFHRAVLPQANAIQKEISEVETELSALRLKLEKVLAPSSQRYVAVGHVRVCCAPVSYFCKCHAPFSSI